MEHVKVIFLKVPPEDFVLASRAAKWMLARTLETKDGILTFDDGANDRRFYVKRNKSSVTVRAF